MERSERDKILKNIADIFVEFRRLQANALTEADTTLIYSDVKKRVLSELAKMPRGARVNLQTEVEPLVEAELARENESNIENFGAAIDALLSNGTSDQKSIFGKDDDITRIGVVFVHGIGEQKRFEHMEAEVREIARALEAFPAGQGKNEVTIEIRPSPGGAYQADQDAWMTGQGGTIRAVLRDPGTKKITHIHFHEVWWADVNEPYSLFKQIRFWLWGLSVWFYPDKLGSTSANSRACRLPRAQPSSIGWAKKLWVRARLFGVAVIAVIGAASVGIAVFVSQRVFQLQTPRIIQVFVNYIAGVKLYNQRRRFGSGLSFRNREFIDSLEQPPRVSIRRRMVRALAEAACSGYDRWYVFGHSLGSVVAFNGLMTPSYAWPGYFTEQQWKYLQIRGFAGRSVAGWRRPAGKTSPSFPVWADDDQVAYRTAIFRNFHGFLTYGCPLEKFATLWPARVELSTEQAFRKGTQWLNVHDPTDPVSGILRSFDTTHRFDDRYCPQPRTVGYAASPFLLLSHISYLDWKPGGGTLADGIAQWLITGDSTRISTQGGPRWFEPNSSVSPWALSARHYRRSALAWIGWFIITGTLILLGAIALQKLLSFMPHAFDLL